ncbi:hypothetical protein GGF31_003081 [Allomyces arbusculus]|nr:hypothetical protein GGF31_003081 [Allomyces arbusculus]
MLSTPPSFNAHPAGRAPPRDPVPPHPLAGYPHAHPYGGPARHGHDRESDTAYDHACAAHDRDHRYPAFDADQYGHGQSAHAPRSGRAPLGVATTLPAVPLPPPAHAAALRGTPTATRSAGTTTDPAFDAPPSGATRATALARLGPPMAPALGPAVATGGGAAAAAPAWPAVDDAMRAWPAAPWRPAPAVTPSTGARAAYPLPPPPPRARAAYDARPDDQDDERRAYYPPPPTPARAAPAAPWREYDDVFPPAPVPMSYYEAPRYPSNYDRLTWSNPPPLPTRPRTASPYDALRPPPVPRARTHSRGSESLDTVRAAGAPFAHPPRSSGTGPTYHIEAQDNAYRPPAISLNWRPTDAADMDIDRVPPNWSRPGRDRPMYSADPYAPYDMYPAPPPPHPWAAMRRALPPPEEYYPHHHHPHSYADYPPAHRPGRHWVDDDPRDAPLPSRPMPWPMPPLPPFQDADRSSSAHSAPRTVPPPSSSSAPGPSPTTTAHAQPEMPTLGPGSGSGSHQASSTSTAPPATMPGGGYFFDEENDHMVVGKRREFFVFNRAYYTTMVLCLQNKAPIPRDVEIRRWKRLMKSLTLLPNYESEPFRCLAWTGGNLIIAPVEDWAAILAAVHVDNSGTANGNAHRSVTQTCKVLGVTYQMRRSRCGIPAEYVEAFCRRCTGCRTITPAAMVVTVPAGQVEGCEPVDHAA